jgi:hypothetical protein
MVLWGSPTSGDGSYSKGGKGKERRSQRGYEKDSALADTSTKHRIFARTGRLEVEKQVLAEQLSQEGFNSASFIQQHLGHMNLAGLEMARSELDRFMEEVQNQVRPHAFCLHKDCCMAKSLLGIEF